MKSFKNEVKSTISGNNLGALTVPLNNFTITIPAVITTNTTASATDNVEVNFKESANSWK